jgi:hypothetical protein
MKPTQSQEADEEAEASRRDTVALGTSILPTAWAGEYRSPA